MALDLPTYIPLEKAAEQFNLAVETLRQNIEDGSIRAAKTSAGNLLVVGEDVGEVKTKLSLEDHLSSVTVDENLLGQAIRITEAAEKYDTSHTNLHNWADYGYIRILEKGPKKLLLDEGDVQLTVEIFKRAKEVTGSSIRAGWILKRMVASLRNTVA